MEKIILVDGNNLLFRSYYATAYSGNLMQNSKGFPTNAIYGFVNMINKIITEEEPKYMIVAFDKGKTFRHEQYDFYKQGRSETPEELKVQFPIAKDILNAMGIKYYECDNYEADDIIGTFARYCDEEEDFIGTIVSSDKDLLQLISPDIDMKLLKQKDYIRYNEQTFFEDYGIPPKQVVDLKALMGDPSDNIPGVKGVGEKTALKLLQQYKTLDGVYEHIDEIKGKLHEKLVDDKENAYMSYKIATIVRDVPMEISIPDIKYRGNDVEKLNDIYEELEFYSLLKKIHLQRNKEDKKLETKIIQKVEEIKLTKDTAVYIEILGTNYHRDKVLGLALYNDQEYYFVPPHLIKDSFSYWKDYVKFTYDLKKLYVCLRWLGETVTNITFDSMIAGYLLDYTIKDDIAYLANDLDEELPFYENVYGKRKFVEPELDVTASLALYKAKFIYESQTLLQKEIEEHDLHYLFYEVEMPLAITLGDMEFDGVHVNKETLQEMGKEIQIKIELLEKDIYNQAGCEFNISSPKELGNILFEKLQLPHGKKNNRGYSTAADTLNKLKDKHPIIELILEYRMLTKLYSTYIDGLMNTILPDGKIHTIFTQTLTRTGRLSSLEPNLQNIPVRYEYGRLIRKAFIPSEDSMMVSSDYSQIELRIFAHMANIETLVEAFKQDMDIHSKTAMDIFHVTQDQVTKDMRRIAKAVNFGIVYGISSFGLSENLGISVGEAKQFMDHYFEAYPGIRTYMDQVKKDAYQKGYVETLLHRKRVIKELQSDSVMVRKQGERMALNTPIQGTSADIIKKAMNEVHDAFIKEHLQSKMILQVHDELVIDCKKSEFEQVSRILKEVMEHTVELRVPLKVDIEYGNNWYEAK
ncbi:MAG TPA: DNA polymerase I [Candidatus Pelethosoma merdigallinarum]|nr:DNA polymerase I [Candidatus Pelethosoma merdigallinarum]